MTFSPKSSFPVENQTPILLHWSLPSELGFLLEGHAGVVFPYEENGLFLKTKLKTWSKVLIIFLKGC